MKLSKRILGVALVGGLFLLSGCGLTKESKLLCKTTASGVDVQFNVDFVGQKISGMNIVYDMDLSKYNDTQIEAVGKQDFCSVVKTSMSQYKDAFTNCNQGIENKKLHVTASLDINKIAKNELEKFSSVEAAKEGLEAVGYTCTVE